MKFDPTDKKWQVSEEFPPDKESTWPFPPERDGWTITHNALRGEMKDFREALAATKTPLQDWQIKAIQRAFQGHLEHIQAHHRNEDDIIVPFLKQRFHYPEKLETDHETLVTKLEKLREMIDNLKVGDGVDGLLEEWKLYETLMKPHLQEEEDVGLPLYRAYFTQKDFAPIIQKLIKVSPKQEVGSMIYYEGVESFRNSFMVQENIPSFVWYVDFMWKLKTFEKVFANNVEALKKGEEWKEESQCLIL